MFGTFIKELTQKQEFEMKPVPRTGTGSKILTERDPELVENLSQF